MSKYVKGINKGRNKQIKHYHLLHYLHGIVDRLGQLTIRFLHFQKCSKFVPPINAKESTFWNVEVEIAMKIFFRGAYIPMYSLIRPIETEDERSLSAFKLASWHISTSVIYVRIIYLLCERRKKWYTVTTFCGESSNCRSLFKNFAP